MGDGSELGFLKGLEDYERFSNIKYLRDLPPIKASSVIFSIKVLGGILSFESSRGLLSIKSCLFEPDR